MRSRYLPAAVLLAVLLGAPDASAERAILLDKYVAIVDGITILRSDVLVQAKPFIARIPEPEKHAPEVAKLYKELLDRMIDDLVVGREAQRLGIEVRDDEVDRAVEMVAAENKLSKVDLEREVKKQGLSLEEYKMELRRQIVDAKWTSLRVRPRVALAPPPQDKPQEQQAFLQAMEVERKKVVAELRTRSYVEVRW